MKYLLDTNICVHLLRGRSDVAHKIDAHGLQNCCISEITKAELLFGQRLAERRGVNANVALLNKFLKSIYLSAIRLNSMRKKRTGSLPADNPLKILTC